jgi:ferrous iron transport protein B
VTASSCPLATQPGTASPLHSVALNGAFIGPRYGAIGAGVALFLLHLVGLAVAVPVAVLIHRFLLRTKASPFLLEMPPYRWLRAGNFARRMVRAGREFLVRAGTVIFAITIAVWAMT